MDLPKETEDIIIDLYSNTKMSVETIINLIDKKNLYREFTFEDFYALLYERQNKEGKRITRTTKDYESNFDNQLYQWRNDEGKDVGEIAELLKEKGIVIKEDALLDRLLKISKHKNKVDSRIIKWRDGSIEISKEEYKEIKSTCKSYIDIQNYFKSKGYDIPYTTVMLKCRGWFNRTENDSTKIKQPTILEGKEEEVFLLRENYNSYDEIAQHFKDKKIDVSRETVRKTCNEIYEKKGKEEPKCYIRRDDRKIEEQIAETVYKLRKNKKYSYKEILDYFLGKEIDVKYSQIVRICKKVFKDKNERMPKYKNKTSRMVNNRALAKLMNHKNCLEIKEYFNNKGIDVSYSFIVKACKKIKINQAKSKKRQLSKIKNKNLIIDAMLKVGEKKKATQEQMKKFAEEISSFYGEDIKFDFEDKQLKMNWVNEKEKDEIER